VDTIVLPPNIEGLFNAVSIEPAEQMFVLLGLPHNGKFYALAHLNITSINTSFSVNECSLNDPHVMYLDNQLRYLRALIPEIKSVLAHNHPFVEESKLFRRVGNCQDVRNVVDAITYAYDMGEFPQFQHLRYDLGRSAAINLLTASELSSDDIRFPGPESFQLLVSENPVSERATYSSFHVCKDRVSPLNTVQFCSDLPVEVARYRELVDRTEALERNVYRCLLERLEAEYVRVTGKTLLSIVSLDLKEIEPTLSRVVSEELLFHIVECARGEISEEDLRHKCLAVDFSRTGFLMKAAT
jgi:hypothetical protein